MVQRKQFSELLVFIIFACTCIVFGELHLLRTTNSVSAESMISEADSQIFEHWYTGSAALDITIPAESIRDRQRETMFLYGVLTTPGNDGAQSLQVSVVPSKGTTYSRPFFDQTVTAGGLFISLASANLTGPTVIYNTPPIFPDMSYRLTWANGANASWRLVIYTRAFQ